MSARNAPAPRRAQLLSLASFCFLGSIYIHLEWLSIAVAAVGSGLTIAALVGHAKHWRERRGRQAN